MPINHLKKIIKTFKGNSDWERIAPSEKMQQYIEGFYVFSCADIEYKQLIFNDGFPAIIFLPSMTDHVSFQIASSLVRLQTGWVNGGVMKNIYINNLNAVDTILVLRFKSYAFYDIFNLSPSFFRNKSVVSLGDINFDQSILDKIYSEKEIIDRIRQIELYIENFMFTPKNNVLFDSAISSIHNAKGQITVSNVVNKIGVNYKWLERNFLNYLGITPKEYIQLQRFIFAYINFTDSKTKDLTEIALISGFYDYNHFLKEFKSYTGKTPLEYINLD